MLLDMGQTQTQMLEEVQKTLDHKEQKEISTMMGAKQQVSAMQVSSDDMAFILFAAICEKEIYFQSKKEYEKTLQAKKNTPSPIGASAHLSRILQCCHSSDETLPKANCSQRF